MSEQTWLLSNDPMRLLHCLKGYEFEYLQKVLRLILCAVARENIAGDPEEERLRAAIELAEGYALENVTHTALRGTLQRNPTLFATEPEDAVPPSRFLVTAALEDSVIAWFRSPYANRFRIQYDDPQLIGFGDAFRDIVQNPTRKIIVRRTICTSPDCRYEQEWGCIRCKKCGADTQFQSRHWVNNPTVVSVAQGIRSDRSYRDLPILADALEEAGCTEIELLNYCRGLVRCGGCLGECASTCVGDNYTPVRVMKGKKRRSQLETFKCKRCDGSGWVRTRKNFFGSWPVELILDKDGLT